ncbi:hypothetical protein VTJ49DRAFT_5400 [Mycothermus thermophilus]|uniref:Fringe-like glycosyltransferase domain-containing protein n=1 Tax=Humicola insolens TaxID=85995 RepID=A0ABR3V4N8_HUMIN
MTTTTSIDWNRVGMGPKPAARLRPRTRRKMRSLLRARPAVGLGLAAVFILLLLWTLLPYDNTVRLAIRWNVKQLRETLLPAPSERWVYAPQPRHPIDVGRDVLVIVKTGYGTRERVPAWLEALPEASLFRDIMVIADSEGDVRFAVEGLPVQKLHVFDAVGHSLRQHLGAFRGHPRVNKYQQLAEAIYRGDEALALQHCRAFGWELDAMKFLSGLEMAYQKYPHKKWYLLVDDDTYLVQPTLFPLLQHLDPTRPHYLGNPVGDFRARFAHGGSGIVLSHAAVKRLIEDQRGLAGMYVASLDETWGDRLLARALLRIGVPLDETYARWFNGEPPALARVRAERVCAPLVSFHKFPTPDAMREVGRQFRDVREVMVWGRLWEMHGRDAPWTVEGAGRVEGWDYVGQPDESTLTLGDVESAEGCRRHCEKRSRACMAWSWDRAARLCHVRKSLADRRIAAAFAADDSHNRTQYIPKIVHHVFHNWRQPGNDTLPADWAAIRRECMELNPDFEFKLWGEKESRDLIETEYPWFLRTYDGYKYPIQRGCKTSLTPLLSYPVWLTDGGRGALSNNILAARPHHPFWQHLTLALLWYDWRWPLPYVRIMYASGQWFVTAVWEEYHALLPPPPPAPRRTREEGGVEEREHEHEHRLYRVMMDGRPGGEEWTFFRHQDGGGGTWNNWDNGLFDAIGEHLGWFLVVLVAGLGLVAWTASRCVKRWIGKGNGGYKYRSLETRVGEGSGVV